MAVKSYWLLTYSDLESSWEQSLSLSMWDDLDCVNWERPVPKCGQYHLTPGVLDWMKGGNKLNSSIYKSLLPDWRWPDSSCPAPYLPHHAQQYVTLATSSQNVALVEHFLRAMRQRNEYRNNSPSPHFQVSITVLFLSLSLSSVLNIPQPAKCFPFLVRLLLFKDL